MIELNDPAPRAVLRFLLCCAMLMASGAYAALSSNVQEHKLGNGMRVIVKEDHRAPVAVSMVWYKAGSMDETSGTTGVAHVLEHMMFKGTETVPGGEFSKIIAAAGGRDNAFTSRDYTAYFQQLHKSKLPLALKLEADRMRNLLLPREEFEKEIRVVMEERRWRTEDKPRSLVYEQLMATAYQAHPYRHPIIGWMGDLENMDVQDTRAWYDKWYAPGNAVLVVVGDVEAKEVFKLAEENFGSIPAKPAPERKAPQEPKQTGVKRVTVKAPAELPYLMMAWHAPILRDPDKDWEPYALDILAGVLDGHDAARLNRSLVREQQLASSIGVSYDTTARGPGMFLIEGVPAQGKTVAELEAAVRAELERIIREGVSEEELKRVKAQVIADEVYKRDSMFYQAMQIGQMETAGLSYKAIDTLVEKLKQVTPEQVQRIARATFQDDQLTVAVLDPQPLQGKKPGPAPRGGRHG
ncbi:MAG TPA: pitrilysin family protein [Burkholderiales bacterium]|nr:pitrilysin family protein [Burkholderiales bacterium]